MESTAIDKAAVARNFSGASGSYDGRARAQSAISGSLVRRIPAGFFPRRIVDLGCGTGFLSVRLRARFPAASLVGIDLADGMVARCRDRWGKDARARFVCADAEHPASLVPGADLVASSCSLQWFADPEGTLRMWAGALNPGGLLAVATLGEGSFAELDTVHREALGVPFPGLLLPGPGELESMVRAAGLAVLGYGIERHETVHRDARDALRSFRETGAVLSALPGRSQLPPGAMRRLLSALDRGCDSLGRVRLTWRALFLVAEKPS